MFFDFAVHYVGGHPETKPDFVVTEEIIEKFKSFLEEKEFEYKTSIQVALEDLEECLPPDLPLPEKVDVACPVDGPERCTSTITHGVSVMQA